MHGSPRLRAVLQALLVTFLWSTSWVLIKSALDEIPPLSWRSWAIIGWLAVINTAFAFTLWNVTLQTLTAVEASIINNTMLVQIAVLAWVFLGETLNAGNVAGLLLAIAGVLVVQLAPTSGRSS